MCLKAKQYPVLAVPKSIPTAHMTAKSHNKDSTYILYVSDCLLIYYSTQAKYGQFTESSDGQLETNTASVVIFTVLLAST